MSTAFLLRYQEPCLPDQTPDVYCGTKTETRIRAEQADNDPGNLMLAAFPRTSASGGTMTKTSIARESGGQDQDRSEGQMPVSGTRTKTKIKGEHAGDFAPFEVSVLAVPRRLAATVAQTKTVTAVKAEADDNDPKRASLQAIPKCS